MEHTTVGSRGTCVNDDNAESNRYAHKGPKFTTERYETPKRDERQRTMGPNGELLPPKRVGKIERSFPHNPSTESITLCGRCLSEIVFAAVKG